MKHEKNIKRNVPNLRFPEFAEEWGLYKLSDPSFNIVAGGDIDKSKLLKEGKYPVIANALTNSGIVGYYSDSYRISPPAVTVTGRGDVGVAVARNLPFTPVVRLLAINTIHNTTFIANAINTHKTFVESTGVPQLTVPQLQQYKIYIPQKPEQQKIATLLSLLDDRISTQMKIIEDLKVLKEEIVESLFSPNIQNKTYTYRDLFTISSARNKDLARANILSASQELGMIERDKLNLDIKFNSDSINTYKLVDDGDYIIHLRSFQGGFAFSSKSGICSPAYTILRPNNLLEYGFLRSYFTSQAFIKSLVIVTYGIRDGRSINVDEFMDLKIQLPPKEVQLKIVSAIDSIMSKIKIEQSILTAYKRQKEYLLREMFI